MTDSLGAAAVDWREFYTIGYSGKTIDAFIDALVEAGVSTLLDIRHLPSSRHRPEFSKRNLDAALDGVGINYVHDRDLGIPSKVRREHGHPEHTESLWKWYDEHVIPERVSDLGWFREIDDGPMAMMCVESNAEDCHRHRIGRGTTRGRNDLRPRPLGGMRGR